MSLLASQRSRVHHAHQRHRLLGSHVPMGRMIVNCGIACALTNLACASPVQEGPADVTVEGGMVPANRFLYSWTVTSAGAGSIVAVEIPHYRGLIFTVPTGWSKDVTELASGSAEVGVGRLLATAPPGGGIRRGQSATFSIQLHARGASAQRGDVIVEFSDGTRVTIANVEYPGMESWLTQHMTLVGMIGLVLAALVVHLLRSARAKRKPTPAT